LADDTAKYDEHDHGLIPSYIHNQLCLLDREDREAGRPPAWHDLTELVKKMNAYDDKTDISYIAEVILDDEMGFIERNPTSYDVRLTQLGRDNCDKGIKIPTSAHQIRPDLFYRT
jgi:hypothetical protein